MGKGRRIRNARLFIILFVLKFGGFVRNFGGVFAILFEVLLIEIQEKIHHFAGWEGGSRGTKIVNKHFVNKHFVNKLPFPTKPWLTILFKIITRMKLLFSNYLGDYSYSFLGFSELIRITVTVS